MQSLAINAGAEPSAPNEYEVKAAYLLNFARFTDWPTNHFSHTNDPLVIGIIGTDPFGVTLDKMVDGKNLNGRPFLIRRLANEADVGGCQLLFIAHSENARSAALLERLKGLPVLTVSESNSFVDEGGMIQFLMQDDCVRFSVNADAARAAGLRISARLLKVAHSVRSEHKQPDSKP